MGVIHDLGNLLIEGWEEPTAAFQLLGEYLAHVHLKNARWTARGPADERGGIRWENGWATLREGQGDVLAYLRALVAHGYDGWITLAPAQSRLRAQCFARAAVVAEEHDEAGNSRLHLRLPQTEFEQLLRHEGVTLSSLMPGGADH